MIYCDGESSRFPESEFRHNKDGKIVLPYIHETGSPHFAEGGKPVEPPPPYPLPSPGYEPPPPPPSLYYQLYSIVSALEETALKLQAEIEYSKYSKIYRDQWDQLIRRTEKLTQYAKEIVHLVDSMRKEN